MGVTQLWHLLTPVCERKSLWDLQNKTVAIDLSCWVCDTKGVQEHCSKRRLYLRNLFFRTSCLLLLGVKPVFVLEGKAPAIKKYTMACRLAKSQFSQKTASQSTQRRRSGKRSHFQGLLKHCEELLRIMGVSCVQSHGEAEAMCAHLNEVGLVDGCVSQDGDCFLYGARTVYRNFTVSPTGTDGSSGFSVDVYCMDDIEQRLQLGREKLIALALFCGCDYKPGGVPGVGRQMVMNFLQEVRNTNVITRLQGWRSNPLLARFEVAQAAVANGTECERCGHSGKRQRHDKSGCPSCLGAPLAGCHQDPDRLPLTDKTFLHELMIRKKALADPYFPSEDVLDEYMQENQVRSLEINTAWGHPDLIKFIKFTAKMLDWTECYAVEKFMPLITRWHLIHMAKGELPPKGFLRITAKSISKKKTVKGVPCYEIQWNDDEQFMNTLQIDDGYTVDKLLITAEPQKLVEDAYPNLVQLFLDEKAAKSKKAKQKSKQEKKKKTKAADLVVPCLCKQKENGKCQHTNEIKLKEIEKLSVKKCQNIETYFRRLSIHEEDNSFVKSKVPNGELSKRLLAPSVQSTPKRTSNSLRKKVLENSVLKYEKHCSNLSNVVSSPCDCSIVSECELCLDSGEEVLDLSQIIEGIVGQSCSPDLNSSCGSKMYTEQTEDMFEEENHIPLTERLKYQSELKYQENC